MRSPREIMSELESLHLEYLVNNFHLTRTSNHRFDSCRVRPDLINSGDEIKALFELKSRIYPINNPGSDGLLQYAWWDLKAEQICGYDEFSELMSAESFWIIMLATMNEAPSSLDKLSENLFLERQIYVLPWNMHELVSYTSRGVKYIGKNKILRNYEFSVHSIKKGELFLEKSVMEKVAEYFL